MHRFAIPLLAAVATPVAALDHSAHAMHSAPAAEATDCEKEAAQHRAMGHPVPEGSCAPARETVAAGADATGAHAHHDHGAAHSGMDHSGMDHSAMEHSAMDHGQSEPMDHSSMNHGAADLAAIPGGPPPPSAGSGPPRAADAIWGADAMRASREALRVENGGMTWFWFQGDRAEYRAREGGDGYLWDVQGYYGGDIDKLWLKSEGEGSVGDGPESAEVQALWSHAIGPWWDLQAGMRQDLAGPGRTHAVLGLQGLAPYLFEIDAAAFLSTEGDLTARIEAEFDERITQRLILQPRAEVKLAAQDVSEIGIGAGVDAVALGLRLRYEIAREFAPYLGVEQEWKLGQSADYARLAGEDPGVTSYVVGVRFWF